MPLCSRCHPQSDPELQPPNRAIMPQCSVQNLPLALSQPPTVRDSLLTLLQLRAPTGSVVKLRSEVATERQDSLRHPPQIPSWYSQLAAIPPEDPVSGWHPHWLHSNAIKFNQIQLTRKSGAIRSQVASIVVYCMLSDVARSQTARRKRL